MMQSLLHANLRRPRSSLMAAMSRGYSSAPSNRVAEALSLSSVGPQGPDHQSGFCNLFAVSTAMLAAAAACTTASIAHCESAADNNKKPKTTPKNDAKEEEEEDPYDNLPEKDEATNCSICLTYRQGPCRPYWRKVEACTKDNELKSDDKKEEGDDDKKTSNTDNKEEEEPEADPPCLKYMLPWIDCASGFRNLYNLIELDTNYTVGIADLENEASKTLCWAASKTPSVNWMSWHSYLKDNPDWKLPTQQKSNSPEHASLWKLLDQSKDPVLVEVKASVNMMEDEGMLECAYAQDQDGNVIGFQYGTKPSEAFETEKKEGEEGETKKEPTVELKIRILPERTQTVTIAAAYTQPPAGGKTESKDGKKDSFDSFIFKSKPIQMDQIPKKEEIEESS